MSVKPKRTQFEEIHLMFNTHMFMFVDIGQRTTSEESVLSYFDNTVMPLCYEETLVLLFSFHHIS
jgi:hypothetical protein